MQLYVFPERVVRYLKKTVIQCWNSREAQTCAEYSGAHETIQQVTVPLLDSILIMFGGKIIHTCYRSKKNKTDFGDLADSLADSRESAKKSAKSAREL